MNSKTKKIKKCKNCGVEFKPYNTIQKYCSWNCKNKAEKDKPVKKNKFYKINARSKKRAKQEKLYLAKRIVFLSKKENSICPVTNQLATQVHHKKGRIGELLLDERFWLGVSAEGHREIEENPEWAKKMGYSISRLSND